MAVLLLSGSAAAQTPPAPAPFGSQEPAPTLPARSVPPHEWNVTAVQQEEHGPIRRLHGHPAELEDNSMLFRADEIELNNDTGELRAEGHVYFRSFLRNEQLWCSRLEYNTEEETGRFYDVTGETLPRIVARKGVLTGSAPFHFEGEWAERIGDKYVLYHGWVTNCTLPNPWWRMKGERFDIIPDDHATSHKAWFFVTKMPLFYAPFFYHSLTKHPRKSGLLMPNIVPRSMRGFMIGLGYYWAINRDYDMTYRVQDFTTQALAHHLDFRGKPREGTDFDFIGYGVQDHGQPVSSGQPVSYSGVNLYAVGKSELGDGWSARGYFNYLSSFRFRQEWSESYNEAIGSEIHSVGSFNKNWSTFSFNVVFSRLENFLSSEIPLAEANGSTKYLTNAVSIRKLPEAQLTQRDSQVWRHLPLWFSFDASSGLLDRSDPIFDNNNNLVYRFQTGQFTNRTHFAPHLMSVLHLGDFHLVPSIGVDETYYAESQTQTQFQTPLQEINPGAPINQVSGANVVRSARDFKLDLIFPTFARVFDKKTFFGDKLKHVIEPRATYKYVTGIGSDFDRYIRFDETDILSNTSELDLSLTNRIYAKRGNTVLELLTWELKQARYFDPTFGGALVPGDRNVFATTADLTAYAFLVGPRSTSPVASILRSNPIGGLSIQWMTDYDPRFGRIVDNDFSADYRWAGKFHVSAGNDEVHNNVAPVANQFRTQFNYGDANRKGMNAGIATVYDYRRAVVLYTSAQATYNTDCCGLSVQYRRYNAGIRDETQLLFSFSIANLGTFGTLRRQDRLF